MNDAVPGVLPSKPRNVRLPDGTRESNVLFANEGGMLHNVSNDSGADLLGNSRSAAYLDYDGDGDLDIILNNFQQDAVLYKNSAETLGTHWLTIRLTGDPGKRSTRDAIGARITLTTPEGTRVWREVQSTIGYLSAHPKEKHFGVGKADRVRVLVEWPNGDKASFDGVAVNKRYSLIQGGEITPVAGAKASAPPGGQ